MLTQPAQRSATIYSFPVGGRKGIGVRANDAKPVAEDRRMPRAAAVALGGACYHDAAIEESKRAGEH